MRTIFFYTVILAFFCGVGIRSLFEVSYDTLVVSFFVSMLLAVWWARRRNQRALLMSLSMLCLVCGVLRVDMATWGDSKLLVTNTQHAFVGTVVREPEQRETTTHIYLELVDHSQTILLYAPRYTEVAYGDVLSVEGMLQLPQSFETDLGRTFNYPGYLIARGVHYVMFRPEITQVGTHSGNKFIEWLLAGKQQLMRAIESVLPEPHAGLGEGLLLGVKSALGEEWETVFRRTGIIHIVVLSGYNVMLVVTFVLAILSYVCGLSTRLLFGLLAIAAFALTVGLSATVVRASIMASLILVAHATGRNYAVIRALFLAGFVMVLLNPYLLAFDPGFQLSFLATLGLILIGPLIESRLTMVPAVVGMRSFLVATLATQICVLPFLLYQIGEFSVVSVLVNVLVLPMVPVAMLLTFLAGVMGLIHTGIATVVGYLAYLSLSYILYVAQWFAALPFAAYDVPTFHWSLMVIAYVAMGYIFWCMTREVKEVDEELAGWTIVTENEVGSRLCLEPTDTPVFFR